MTATNDQISYAEFTLTVPANSSIPIERQSDFVACLSSTADFKIRLNNSPSAFFTAGLTVEPIGGLESVQVVNDTATPLTVTLAFGRGNIRDSRVTLNPTQILPTRESAPDVIADTVYKTAGAGAQQLLAAANPLRRQIVLTSYAGNANYATIGSIAVTDHTKGTPIYPGQTLVMDTSAAVYAYGQTTNQIIYVQEMEWSS